MRSTMTTNPLISLKSGEIELADPNEDIRGRKVVDQDGQEIGKVDDVFVDPDERRARFIVVKSGDILGLGGKKFLIPVDAIESLDDEGVTIAESRDRILGGPQVEGEARESEVTGAGATSGGAVTGNRPAGTGGTETIDRRGAAGDEGAADEDAGTLVIAVYRWYDVDQPYWSPDYRRPTWT